MTIQAPPAVPWFLRIPAVVALSVVGAGLGLAVISFYPHSGPDEAFLARLKWWKENAASLQKRHHLQEPGIWKRFLNQNTQQPTGVARQREPSPTADAGSTGVR